MSRVRRGELRVVEVKGLESYYYYYYYYYFYYYYYRPVDPSKRRNGAFGDGGSNRSRKVALQPRLGCQSTMRCLD